MNSASAQEENHSPDPDTTLVESDEEEEEEGTGTVRKKAAAPHRPPRQRDIQPVRAEYYNLCYPAPDLEATGPPLEPRLPIGPPVEARSTPPEIRNRTLDPTEPRVPTIPRRREAVVEGIFLLFLFTFMQHNINSHPPFQIFCNTNNTKDISEEEMSSLTI
jgi:hypothetical protein